MDTIVEAMDTMGPQPFHIDRQSAHGNALHKYLGRRTIKRKVRILPYPSYCAFMYYNKCMSTYEPGPCFLVALIVYMGRNVGRISSHHVLKWWDTCSMHVLLCSWLGPRGFPTIPSNKHVATVSGHWRVGQSEDPQSSDMRPNTSFLVLTFGR